MNKWQACLHNGREKKSGDKLEVPEAYKGVTLLVYSKSELYYLKLIKGDR